MGRILRVGLMVLLVAAAGVGIAWGEWKEYTPSTPGAITWQYERIGKTNTCSIKPKDTATISGKVDIPGAVEVNGVSLTVVEIGADAFLKCSRLTAVDIPNSVTEIRLDAFWGCSGLTEVTLPSKLTLIKEFAFSRCGLKEVKIPSSVKTIGFYAFSYCEELTTVVIPSSVKSISGWTFSGCTGLTAVTIHDGVTEIGLYAFNACKELKEVTIPGSVERIDKCAFKDCKSLNTVYVYRSNDQEFTVDSTAFKGIDPQATLYVRLGMKEKIKDKPWCINGKIKNIVEFCVVTFDANGGTPTPDAQTVVKYRAAAEPKAPTKEGYTFAGWQLDGKKYDFNTGVTKDIELVAVWKQNFTVTFDAKGGTPAPGAQTVVEDGTATAPTLTKDGYTFVEWRLDGKKYDFSTPVTKDIKLVAKWKKNEESTPKDPKTAVESVQLAGVRVVRNPMGEVLELEGMERAARVEVYSVVGVRVHAEALRGEPRVVIDARGWASGVYVVRVVASDGERTLRVVK